MALGLALLGGSYTLAPRTLEAQGVDRARGSVPGTLLTSSTTQACTIADTNPTVLATFTVPAGTLNQDGKSIVIKAEGTTANNVNAKTASIVVAGTTAATVAGFTTAAQPFFLEATVTRISATSVKITNRLERVGSLISSGSRINTLAVNTANSFVITSQGTNGVASANDICVERFTVEIVQSTNGIVVGTGGSVANPLLVPDGTASVPGFAFASASNNGFFSGTLSPTISVLGSARAGWGSNSVGYQLDQSYPLSWASTTVGTASELFLFKDAANTLAQRNSTNAQVSRIYGTFTDASNYERLAIGVSGTSVSFIQQFAGTGTARPMQFGVANGAQWRISTTGMWEAVTDNTNDIGSSGANRPRTGYFANALAVSNSPASAGTGLRLPNAGGVFSRNAANTGDGTLLQLTAQDVNIVSGPSVSLADLSSASIGATGTFGELTVLSIEDTNYCKFRLAGTSNATAEVLDSGSLCSTTAGTASSINVYWSAGNARYEIENRRGGARQVKLVLIGS